MSGVYEGRIETVSNRLLTGWIRTATPAEEFLTIDLLADGRALGSVLAQSDPSTADLRYGFEFLLPRHLDDQAPHSISARIAGTDVALANATHRLSPPPPPPPVAGFLDAVTAEGNVVGWAWYPEDPTLRAELEVLADNQPVGTLEARAHRADLLTAGIGDGNYGFSWPLPLAVLAVPRNMRISVRDKHSGKILPQPLMFERPSVTDALTKIALLEADVTLLRGALASLAEQPRQESLAARELFDIAGKFFARLGAAQSNPEELRALRPVDDALAAVTSLPAITLPATPTPLVSVFLAGGPSAAEMHTSLGALATALGSVPAEFFLLDTGLCPDAPLLPLVAHNLRYARLQGTDTARLNAAMRLAAGKICVFINAGLTPEPGWGPALAEFATGKEPAMLAGQLLRPDGLVHSAGLEVHDDQTLPRAAGRLARGLATPAPVAAPDPAMFALRRAAWETLGGFDETQPSLTAAIVELAAKGRARALLTMYNPELTAIITPPADI